MKDLEQLKEVRAKLEEEQENKEQEFRGFQGSKILKGEEFKVCPALSPLPALGPSLPMLPVTWRLNCGAEAVVCCVAEFHYMTAVCGGGGCWRLPSKQKQHQDDDNHRIQLAFSFTNTNTDMQTHSCNPHMVRNERKRV